MELRDEADTLHRRQPYAHLTAVVFMLLDATYDACSETGHSSFAHAVHTFRKRTGRESPESRTDLFERVYIGMFEADGSVRFFNVAQRPRGNQPPPADNLFTVAELIDDLTTQVTLRNTGLLPGERWAENDPEWVAPHVPGLFFPPSLEIEDTMHSGSDEDSEALEDAE